MAYNVPTNPFLQGTVLNTDRFTNYYLQQEAHKQAKEDALNKYNDDLVKNITPAGMRTQDIEGLMPRVKEWTDFGVKNRAAINNPALDNGVARAKFYGDYQGLQGGIAKSKSQAAEDKTFASSKNDPDKYDRITPETIQKKALSDLSIWDDNYKSFSTATDLAYQAAPFDLKKQEELDRIGLSNLPFKETRKTIGVSKRDGLMDDIEITTTLSPENKVAAAKTYADAYEFDKSVKRGIDEIAAKIAPKPNAAGILEIPKDLDNYSKLYTSIFPTDHFLNNDGTVDKKKLAFAYGLSRLPSDKTKQVEELNKAREDAAQQAKQKELIRYRNSFEIAAKDYEAKLKGGGTSTQLFDAWTPIQKIGDAVGVGREIPINTLPSVAIDVLVKHAKGIYDTKAITTDDEGNFTGTQYKPLNVGSLKLKYNSNGTVNLFTVKPVVGKYKDGTPRNTTDLDVDLGNLNKEQINLLVTKGMKERAEQVGNINAGSQATPLPKEIGRAHV